MIINSIDIMSGKAVQLRQGKEKILEVDNPLQLVERFDRFGQIAVIDLDAAFGIGENESLIRKICTKAECRVGGGIRDIAKAKRIYRAGADKIIIGTSAFTKTGINREFMERLVQEIGKQNIIIAIDAFQGKIVTKGWKEQSSLLVMDVISELEPYCIEFLLTIVEKEGCLQGTDWNFIRKVKDSTKTILTVAGGITNLEDIKTATELDVNVQVGMAVYSGKLDLNEALIETVDWNKSELVPTITEDENGQVLMLAYSNRESLIRTLELNRMTYYSRSRKQLWTKGETSGNYQVLKKIRLDCDRDTIKVTVAQTGNACHLEQYSCFGPKDFSMEELLKVINKRLEDSSSDSYTASLDDQQLRAKIREETEEVCVATDYENKIWEVADLLYFLLVYMAKEDIAMDQVLNELQRRRRK